MCAPVVLRVLFTIAAQMKWRISKVDVASAFLQTGPAERNIYLIPPSESSDRGRALWLLLFAAYGLVNANAKFQVQSDQMLISMGFNLVRLVPQLFKLRDGSGNFVSLLANVVDNNLLSGDPDLIDPLITSVHDRFKLGTITHGPGETRFFA